MTGVETKAEGTRELDRFSAEVELVHEIDLDVHEEIATATVDDREVTVCLAYSKSGGVYVQFDDGDPWERVRLPLRELLAAAHEHTSEAGSGPACEIEPHEHDGEGSE